jgi:hypothetical protein
MPSTAVVSPQALVSLSTAIADTRPSPGCAEAPLRRPFSGPPRSGPRFRSEDITRKCGPRPQMGNWGEGFRRDNPGHGGSHHVPTKINQAKELLLHGQGGGTTADRPRGRAY